MRCDTCPNWIPDTGEHNAVFYELHVYMSHSAAAAARIIDEFYARFPEKKNDPALYHVIRPTVEISHV